MVDPLTKHEKTGKERFEEIQRRLEARGVRDIKFAWGSLDKPLSVAAHEVADVLEAYLNGETIPMPPLNDRPISSNQQLQRWSQWCAATHGHELVQHEMGGWVRYSDAMAEIERLRAMLWSLGLEIDGGRLRKLSGDSSAPETMPPSSNRVTVESGIAWAVGEDGIERAATNGQCADEIQILLTGLRTIAEQGGDVIERWSAEIARRTIYGDSLASETKSDPTPDLQSRCNHGRIVHATWICPECSAEHERDSNAQEPPARCICGRGKYYHPWRFCDTYTPVPKTPSAQETSPRPTPAQLGERWGDTLKALANDEAPPKASEDRRPTGQCSWGCYYNAEEKLVRDPACTVHGAS